MCPDSFRCKMMPQCKIHTDPTNTIKLQHQQTPAFLILIQIDPTNREFLVKTFLFY